MKTELAMGLIAKVAARGGEHGGKDKPAKTGGFDEALAAKAEKRMPQGRGVDRADRADRADDARPHWRLGERLVLAMPLAQTPGDDAPDPRDDLSDLLPPAAPEMPARDDPETPEGFAAAPGAERDAPAMQEDVAATPAASQARNDPAMPREIAATPAALQAQRDPQPEPARNDAATAPRTMPAVAAATTTAAETQPRPRGERGQPARPAPAVDAAAGDDGGTGKETATPRNHAAAPTVMAATNTAQEPAKAAQPEPAPEPRRPDTAAQKPAATQEPAAAQARPATPQPDGTAEQPAQRPAAGPAPDIATAPRPEAPATGRAGAPAPQLAEPAAATQPRVTVLGASTAAPAPFMPVQLNPTAAGLVAAVEAEPTWRAAAAEAASPATQRGQGQGSISTLRIQLNPAELGMVTARLTVAGPQLEIEIKVESNDARQRLATDSDAIVKALRALGYDIDKVTIQQAPQTSGPAPQQGAQGRDSFLNGQSQERADANAGGCNGQGSESGGGTNRHGAGETAAERPGGGVYI